MNGFDDIRDREIEHHRRTMLYALVLMLAIVLTVVAVILAYA